VIKSFKEEIQVPSPTREVLDLASDSEESQLEVNYFFEAFDDELDLFGIQKVLF
jgi:hypothetical protein